MSDLDWMNTDRYYRALIALAVADPASDKDSAR